MNDQAQSQEGRVRSLSRPRVIWGLATVAALVVVGLMSRPEPLPVDIAEAVYGPMHVAIEEDGRTRVKDRFQISAPVTGTLLRLGLEPGDVVEAGEVVAFLGPASSPLLDARSRDAAQARLAAARAALEQANASIARGEAALAMAEEEVTRQEIMLELGTGTPFRLRQTELQYKAREEELNSSRFGADVATHEVESARAALRRIDSGQGTAAQVEITSPVTGTVLKVFREDGGLVQAGTPVLEIGDPGTLEVVVDVLTADAVRVQPGCQVALTRWGGGHEIEGSVHQIEPSAFTKVSALGVEEQRVNVIVDLVDSTADWTALGDGYQVDVAIIVWQEEVLHVPSGAVFPIEGEWGVYVAGDGGRAELRRAVIGERNADRVQIVDGVVEGEMVIVYPSDSVIDEARINPRPR